MPKIVDVDDIMITEYDTLEGYNGTEHLFTLDELQNVKISNSEDTSDITGKKGRRLGRLKQNKAVTISGTSGVISGGLLALQVGSDFATSEAAPIKYSEDVTITGNTAVISYEAVGTTGNEIAKAYIKDEGSFELELLEQDASVADGKFTYTPDTKTLTFNDGAYADGTIVTVHYFRSVKGAVLENNSEKFSGKCTLYLNARGEDTCGNVHLVQIEIPIADFSGSFDLEMSDNQTTHPFEATSLAGSCKKLGGNYWKYTVFDIA